MTTQFVIEAQRRDDKGKGASRRLRRAGQVPGIVYGADKEPTPLTLKQSELDKQLENEAFFSHILTVNLDGKSEQVVLKDMQRHPSKPIILHMDFQRVSSKEKLRMQVPLHFANEESSPAVKKGGLVSHNMTEVEITCLPKDLPEFIEVDLGALEMNQSVHLSDLKLPKGVELVELTHGADHDLPVVSVHLPRGAKEEEAEEGEGEE